MNHTKEPWKADLRLGCFAIYPNGQDRNCLDCAGDDAIVYQNGRGDKSSPGGYRYLTAEQEANAKRIVACVNACAGITNEALEKGVVLDSVRLHEAILDQQPSSFFNEYGVKVWEMGGRMNIIEAAKQLGCSTTTVYKYVKSGQIKATTTGGHPANKIEIAQADLDEFAKSPENLLTKEEVATLKGVSIRTVEAWVLKGKLKPVLTFMKRNYFSPEDV